MKNAWTFGAVALFVAAAPLASAEFGEESPAGWPIGIDGTEWSPDRYAHAENRIGPVTVFPYYPILTLEVQRLAAEHPDRVRLTSVGQSTLGLDLWMLEIADFDRLDGGDPAAVPLEDREVVWVDGGTHSNEYSGVYFTLAVAQYLIEESGGANALADDERARWIVENRHTWILPMVNPDGSNVMGRLNANLVNINRNYPVVWDGVGHDPIMNNRGPAPGSEIETQITIAEYNRTGADYMASVHCCGNLWLYPYGEEGVDPPKHDHQMLETVCDLAFPDVREDCGPIWSTIYPASGSSVDTAYEYAGAVAFGYEMSGRGAAGVWGAPLTVESVREQEYESWDGLMHAFENVHRYGAYPVVTAARADGDELVLTVENQGYANLTEAHFRLRDGHAMIDFLGAGESTAVRLAAPAQDETLEIEYVKREMARPTGTIQVPLAIDGPAPDGGFSLGGEVNDAPAPALLMALGAVAAAAVALRRR